MMARIRSLPISVFFFWIAAVPAVEAMDSSAVAGNEPPPVFPAMPASVPPGVWTTGFGEYPVGAGVPPGWSAHHAPCHYEIAESPRRLVVRSMGSGRPFLSWDIPGVIEGDVEVATLVRQRESTLPEMPTTRFQVHLHAATDRISSYLVDYTGTERQGVRIRRFLDGSDSTRASANVPFAMHVWHHVVFQRRGNDLRAKIWPYHTEEPEHWTVETQDATHSGGRAGVGFFAARLTQEFAWFSVATGPHEAERAPEGLPGIPSPALPWPPAVQAVARYGAISLDWEPVAGADHYEIRRDGSTIAHGWENPSFTDAAIPAGTRAVYQVRGVSVLRGAGSWSEPVQAERQSPPAAHGLSFETQPGHPWTPHSEEEAFLQELAAASPRMAVEEIARSGQGRPIHLVRIGAASPPADATLAAGPTVLLIGGNHGNEPAGRQGVLFMIRKMATSDDPQVLGWLNAFSVIAVPTMNPDGRVANTHNLRVPNIDANRDNVNLRSLETRAIAALLRDYRPIAVADAHEKGGSSSQQPGELEVSTGGNANVHPDVLALGQEMAFDWVMRRLNQSSGFRSGPYQELYGQPTRVRQISPIKHAISLLTESCRSPEIRRLDESELSRDDPGTRNRRVSSQRFALSGFLSFLEENLDRVTEAWRESQEAAEWNRGPLFTRGSVIDPPGPADTLYPPPFGWVLPTPVGIGLAEVLGFHGIGMEMRQMADGREIMVVPAAQWARPVALIALDPDSPDRLGDVHATRLYEEPLPNHGLAMWGSAYFSLEQRADPLVSGPLAVPAGDRIPNLVKYALGMSSPFTHEPDLMPRPQRVSSVDPEGDSHAALLFNIVNDDPLLEWKMEFSEDLLTWHHHDSGPGGPFLRINREDRGDGTETVRVGVVNQVPSERVFLRLRLFYRQP